MPFDGKIENELQAAVSRAQEILRRDGWCRHYLTDRQGRHCLWGAILAVVGNDYYPLQGAVNEESEARSRHHCWSVAWNDTIAKDANDVIDFLEGVKRRLA